MKTTLEVGDVVTLKSGGPQMTITKVEGDEAFCLRFSTVSDDFKTVAISVALLAPKVSQAANPYGGLLGAQAQNAFNQMLSNPAR